ncbi:hypothetical protein AWC38_SpisGene24576 [Stylophora pistillata]|uniref:Uncharacterized protein n=1 Tax=Stylophora pistillata TaxID=50429 RepID=A0A2B4R5H8_STYPI|nr:hypothetical protein AWC38_SpisGene24576 [Stylophora pistillata]
MQYPLSSYRGVDIVHETIPSDVRTIWRKQNFTDQSLDGHLGFYEDRNGLLYPVYQDDYRYRGVMLPQGYEPTNEHALMGATFLASAGHGTVEILEQVLGIPSAYAGVSSLSSNVMQKALTLYGGTVMAMGSEALKTIMKAHPYMAAVTTGLALDTMLNNGRLSRALVDAVERGLDYTSDLLNALDRLVEMGRGNFSTLTTLEQLDSLVVKQKIVTQLKARANAQSSTGMPEPNKDDESDDEGEDFHERACERAKRLDDQRFKVSRALEEVERFLGRGYKDMELGLSGEEDPKLPEEFRTDEWWKKRGL